MAPLGDSPPSLQFVGMQPLLVRYNSRLPCVVYVPEGFAVRRGGYGLEVGCSTIPYPAESPNPEKHSAAEKALLKLLAEAPTPPADCLRIAVPPDERNHVRTLMGSYYHTVFALLVPIAAQLAATPHRCVTLAGVPRTRMVARVLEVLPVQIWDGPSL
uniref:Uncharacterized protein n=2 Tax=Emiliania huxleyi TaxID=2903 RepID=A0A0D3IW15_EMIH1